MGQGQSGARTSTRYSKSDKVSFAFCCSDSSSTELHHEEQGQLVKELAKLKEENAALRDEVQKLRSENNCLAKQLDAAKNSVLVGGLPDKAGNITASASVSGPTASTLGASQHDEQRATSTLASSKPASSSSPASAAQSQVEGKSQSHRPQATTSLLASQDLKAQQDHVAKLSIMSQQLTEQFQHAAAGKPPIDMQLVCLPQDDGDLNDEKPVGDAEEKSLPVLGTSGSPPVTSCPSSYSCSVSLRQKQSPCVVTLNSVKEGAEKHALLVALHYWTDDPAAPSNVLAFGYKRIHVWASPAFLQAMNVPVMEQAFKAIDGSMQNSAVRQNNEGFLRTLLLHESRPVMCRNVMYHSDKPCEIRSIWLVPVAYKKEDGSMERYAFLSVQDPYHTHRLYEGVMRDHMLLKYTPYMLALVDLQGAIITQNPLSCYKMGFHSAVTNFGNGWMTKGLPQVDYLQELFLLDDSLRASMLRVTAQGSSFSCTLEITSPVLRRWLRLEPSSRVWHEVHVTRLKDPVLMEPAFVVAQMDVTDRILAEKQVSRLQTQVKKLVGRMQGQEADKLLIMDKIGQGGFGSVHKGVWRNLAVAVKMMLVQDDARDGQLPDPGSKQDGLVIEGISLGPVILGSRMQAVLKEAAVCRSLNHPHVVSTYHFDIQQVTSQAGGKSLGGLEIEAAGEAGGQCADYKVFLVQELCDCSLHDALRSHLLHPRGVHRPDLPVLLTLLGDVARGMAHLHSRNIVHGDLSTSNILLKVVNAQGGEEVVGKITDFGLCQLLDPQQTHVSNHNFGTPFYVAPEVASNHMLTRQSDVYSFGVIMWEAYTGLTPWNITPQGLFVQRQGFGAFHSRTPGRYSRLAACCLRPDPSERPTFEELASELLLIGEVEGQRAAKNSLPLAEAGGSGRQQQQPGQEHGQQAVRQRQQQGQQQQGQQRQQQGGAPVEKQAAAHDPRAAAPQQAQGGLSPSPCALRQAVMPRSGLMQGLVAMREQQQSEQQPLS